MSYITKPLNSLSKLKNTLKILKQKEKLRMFNNNNNLSHPYPGKLQVQIKYIRRKYHVRYCKLLFKT